MATYHLSLIDILTKPKYMLLIISNFPRFFTNWFLLVLIFAYYTNAYFDIHLLATFVLLTFLYIQNVQPQYIYLVDSTGNIYNIGGIDLAAVSLLFHVIPFFISLVYVPVVKANLDIRQANSLLLALIYIILWNPETVYHLSSNVFISLFIISYMLVRFFI